MRRYPLGVVSVVFGGVPVTEAAERAARAGFDHIDVAWDSPAELALPVGDRVSYPHPRPGCSTPVLPDRPGAWEETVRRFRDAPGALLEPWPGGAVDTVEEARAIVDEVPGLRLLVDTGHVATWGEDPAELLDLADHVQLRQARRGVPQTLEGDVDFGAVLRRLDEVGYTGRLSVEYMDLPDRGFPLDDPLGHALALADHVRPLLEARP